MIIGLTEIVIYALIMSLGASLAVIVPYILNKWNDPSTVVEWKYVLVLVASIMIGVLFALPDSVDVINLSIIKTALLTGYGLQAIIGKIAKSIVQKGEVQ